MVRRRSLCDPHTGQRYGDHRCCGAVRAGIVLAVGCSPLSPRSWCCRHRPLHMRPTPLPRSAIPQVCGNGLNTLPDADLPAGVVVDERLCSDSVPGSRSWCGRAGTATIAAVLLLRALPAMGVISPPIDPHRRAAPTAGAQRRTPIVTGGRGLARHRLSALQPKYMEMLNLNEACSSAAATV